MKINYAWDRIRQFGFSAFMYLAPLREAKVIQGAGSVYRIPGMVKKEGKKKVLVVTTPGFIKRGSLEKLFQAFFSAYFLSADTLYPPFSFCTRFSMPPTFRKSARFRESFSL